MKKQEAPCFSPSCVVPLGSIVKRVHYVAPGLTAKELDDIANLLVRTAVKCKRRALTGEPITGFGSL